MRPLSPFRQPMQPHPIDARRRAAWWGRATIAAMFVLALVVWP